MKSTTLFFTVSIPVTYDERSFTEEQALDGVQRAAEEAIRRVCDGRRIDRHGKHTDCTGPIGVVTPTKKGERARRALAARDCP